MNKIIAGLSALVMAGGIGLAGTASASASVIPNPYYHHHHSHLVCTYVPPVAAVYGWETIQVQHNNGGDRAAGNSLDGPGAYLGYETSSKVWAQLTPAMPGHESCVWVKDRFHNDHWQWFHNGHWFND